MFSFAAGLFLPNSFVASLASKHHSSLVMRALARLSVDVAVCGLRCSPLFNASDKLGDSEWSVLLSCVLCAVIGAVGPDSSRSSYLSSLTLLGLHLVVLDLHCDFPSSPGQAHRRNGASPLDEIIKEDVEEKGQGLTFSYAANIAAWVYSDE